MDTEVSFGAWLRRRRRLLDLTQAELAQRVGCAVVTIRKLEADELRPSKQMAERLAQFIEVAPEQYDRFTAFARSTGRALVADALPVRHNLPLQTTPFIGRARELADLGRLLADPTVRQVTILGPGGMGKTRLALAMAARHLEQSHERVLFVPLASLQSVEELTTAIASAAGYRFAQDGREAREQLLDYLRQKQLLLVLDNVEQVREGVVLVHAILQAAPGVKVLATSRERLQLSAETVFALGGMPYHRWETVADALAHDTVQLFVQAARRARPDFELTAEDVAPVARICHRVGGMPLGIVLAAAWVDLLTPAEIAAEIDRNLDLLAAKLRDAPERQRSIRAVFEHAWRLLGGAERTVLTKLAIFRGGFLREAAQSVAGASLPILSTLVDKSLLQREPNGRYTIHELLRQYAEDELRAAGQAETTAGAHSAYYAGFLAQREDDLKGRRQKAAVDEIEAELENVRLAWNWAVQHAQVNHLTQATESLGLYYEWRSHLQEGERAFAHAAEQLATLDSRNEQRLLVHVWGWQFRFNLGLGHSKDVKRLLQQSLTLLDGTESAQHDSRPERAAILNVLGHLAYEAGDQRAASSWYEQSLALYRDLGDRWRQARVLLEMQAVYRNLHGLGDARQHQQQAEKAKQLVLESLAICRELEDQANIAAALVTLGITYLTLGQPREALPAFEECIALCNKLDAYGDTFIDAIGYLGVAKEFLGHYTEMAALGRTSLALAEEIHYWWGERLGCYLIGGAALAEKAYPEAEQWLAQAVVVTRKAGRTDTGAFSLTGRALATYWLGNQTAARQQLAEAMQVAVTIGTIRAAVHGLLLAALLLADQGEDERAVEIHALAASFPFAGNSRWCYDVAGRQLATVAAALPPDVASAARIRGQARDVWTTLEEVLAWLESSRGATAR